MSRRRISLLFLCLLVAFSAAAQHKENFEKGFSPNKLYHLTELDHVNLFNGNLVITIPIGDTYHLGGGTSYALTLTYNSQVWEFMEVTPIAQDNPPCCMPWAYPNRRSNTGLGWTLSLGRRMPVHLPSIANDRDGIQSYAYESPSGGEHRFDETIGPDQLTSDGTYLRWRSAESRLDAGDGTVRSFHPSGTLASLTDRHGNFVNVDEEYSSESNPANRSLVAWRISDSAGRNHSVYFRVFSGTTTIDPGFSPQNNYKRVVDRVELQTAGGTVTYSFKYGSDANDEDSLPTLVPSSSAGIATGYPSTFNLPLLRKVVLPDGSAYAQMRYRTTDASPGDGGMLSRLTLPTRGKLAWAYGQWTFPAENCGEPGWRHITYGVREREMLNAAGVSVGKWTYANELTDDAWTQCDDGGERLLARTSVTTMTRPSQHKETSWYTVWPVNMADRPELEGTLYGAPLSPLHKDATNTRSLSSQSFVCPNGTCPPQAARERYIRYEVSPTANQGGGRFARIRSERIKYEDGTYIDRDHDQFDGFGHFRQTTISGTVPSTAQRSMFTNYNPGSNENGLKNGAYLFAHGDAWLLNRFTEQSITESGRTTKTLHCFDGTGFQTRVRRLSAAAGTSSAVQIGKTDVLSVFTSDHGNVGSESYYGGDVPVTDPGLETPSDAAVQCSFSPSRAAQYRIQHTYAHGALQSSQYFNGFALMPFKTVDRTIGPSGAVAGENDVSGQLHTTYSYDPAHGKLWKVIPETGTGLATTTYTYAPAQFASNTFTPARVTVTRGDTTSEFEYDPFGRLQAEYRLMPGIGQVVRRTTYYAEGQVYTASEWAPVGGITPSTTTTYDAFGRPDTVTRPDLSTISHQYTGITTVRQTSSVGTSINGQSNVTMTQHYDGHGRLTKVEEPAANTTATTPIGGIVTTTYTYDVTGGVATVQMSDGAVTQPRTFQYDGRGFLLSESLPEIDGVVTHSDYDARGHARKRVGGGRTLRHTFDAAERLTAVAEIVDQIEKPLKSFAYGTANDGGNLRLGKLVTAVRHNELPSAGKIDVTETYEYATPSGQMSKRTTLVESVVGGIRKTIQKFDYGTTYDDLGLPDVVTMPTCSENGCVTGGATGSISHDRTRGYLTAVGSLGSLAYHPSGMVKTVSHLSPSGAAFVDSYEATHGLPRPSVIRFSGDTVCPAPATPAITTAPTVCPNSTQTASVLTRSGITHSWTISGGTITSGTTGDSITFVAGASGNVTLTVTASNSCGTVSSSAVLAISSTPAAPAILAPSSVCPGSQGNTASVNPMQGASYSWQISGGTITSGTSGSSIAFTAQSQLVTLTLTMTTSCGTVTTSKQVSVADAPLARLSLIGSDTLVRGSGQSATLQVWLEGSSPWRLQWGDGTVETVSVSPYLKTVSPNEFTEYVIMSVRSGNCEGTTQGAVYIKVVPPGPAWVAATTNHNGTVRVSWAAVPGVAGYRIERTTSLGGTPSTPPQDVGATTTWTDVPVPASSVPVTYIYYVRSIDTHGAESQRGAFDHATTATSLWQQPVVPYLSKIRAADVQELRKAVDAFRAAFGFGPAFAGAPLPSGRIPVADLNALIAAMAPARQVAGYPPFAYTVISPPASNQPIRAEHILQLRKAVE